MPIDDRTPLLNLPLPNSGNFLEDDADRLRTALGSIDTFIAARQTAAQVNTAITTAINALVAGAPGALNTLKELADAINDDASFAASVTTALAGKLSNAPATVSNLGGVKIGAGLQVAGDGTVSLTGSGLGSLAYQDILLTITAPGQTAFTIPGGYIPGFLDVYRDGVKLVAPGDGFTAPDGTNMTLVAGVTNGVNKVSVRVWNAFTIANAVAKNGDTMTGKLNFLASGASGAGINIGQGSAPTTPTNGDIWATITGFFFRVNGATKQASMVGHTHAPMEVDFTDVDVASTAYTLASGERARLLNAAASAATLPPTPPANTIVAVLVRNGRTDNTVARNGQTIEGLAEDMVLNIGNGLYILKFIGTTWRLIK